MIPLKDRYDWMYLGLQDFKTASEYNSTVLKISSQLKLYEEKVTEEDMLEKNVHHISCFECDPSEVVSRA